MTYNYQIQNIHKAKCMYMYILVRVYLLHAWIQEFSPGWWAVRAQQVEKSPDNLFSHQLILQWGSNVYFKETVIFPESKQGEGVKNVRGSNLFQGGGAQLLFFNIACCFPGIPDSLYPHLDSRIASVHVSMFVAF